MANPFQPVERGTPFGDWAQADRINTWIAAAKALRGKSGQRGGGLGELPPSVESFIRNDTDHDLPAFAVLHPDAVILSLASRQLESSGSPIYSGIAPPDECAPIVVTVEPIAVGEIGRAVVQGQVPVRVTFETGAEAFAKPSAGVTGGLVGVSDESQARIIDHISGLSTQWAFVWLGGSPSCETTTTTTTPEPCDGSCTWDLTGGEWVLTGSTCTGGCVCVYPGACLASACEDLIVDIPCGHETGPAPPCLGSTTSTTSPPPSSYWCNAVTVSDCDPPPISGDTCPGIVEYFCDQGFLPGPGSTGPFDTFEDCAAVCCSTGTTVDPDCDCTPECGGCGPDQTCGGTCLWDSDGILVYNHCSGCTVCSCDPPDPLPGECELTETQCYIHDTTTTTTTCDPQAYYCVVDAGGSCDDLESRYCVLMSLCDHLPVLICDGPFGTVDPFPDCFDVCPTGTTHTTTTGTATTTTTTTTTSSTTPTTTTTYPPNQCFCVTSGGVTSCVNRDPLPGETFTGPFDCELCDFLCSLASSTTLAP